MLQVQSSSPNLALRPFIRLCAAASPAWRARTDRARDCASGCHDRFEFAGSYEVRNYGTETLEDVNAISIIGPQSWRRSRLIIRGNIESFVVMFQPMGFSALFGMSTEPLSEGGTEGHSVLGRPISCVHQQMGNVETFQERVQVLDRFFLRQADRLRTRDPILAALVRLARPVTEARIDDLARQAGVSCRQLERKSLTYAGIAPKTVAIITRFNHALQLHATRSLTWTDIAQEVGHHDQMHLIRDFRVFAGSAPTSALEQVDSDDLIHYARG